MGGLLDRIITWSIYNRFVVLLGAVAVVIAGVWAASRASLDVLPDFTPPRVVVQTEARGLATTDVEQLVTLPLERALLGTPQATSVRSTSMSGLSVITMWFEDGLDIYRARQLVTERIQLARAQLPAVVDEPRLQPISAPIGALLKFAITAGQGHATPRELRTFAEWTLKPRLLAVTGIAQVTALGGDVERVEVRPDPVRLRERGVKLVELVAAVKAAQALMGAGFVNQGEARIDVMNESRLTIEDAASQLAQAVISMKASLPVRVGDVAEVVHGDEPPVGAALYDGKPAVFIQVTKLPWADTMGTTERVEAVLEELTRALPPAARMEPPVFRQASFIHTSIFSVGRAMLIGALLVIVVLFALLRRGQLAVISLTAIPLSILTAVLVLVAMGYSINGMTLGGLAIAVGEVVDDAIIDVENIWRRLRDNAQLAQPRATLDVIHDASKEVRSAVVYATVIVCLVLTPVILLGGIAGRIFSPLGHAYILAILASLAVALTVTPALCAWILPRMATKEARLPSLSHWLIDRYGLVLRRVVHHPRLVIGLSGFAAAGAIVGLFFLGGRFLPEFHENALIAHISAVPGTSLEATTRLSGRIDQQLRPAVASHVLAHVGRAQLGEDTVPVNQSEIDVLLKPGENREWDEVVLDVMKRIGQVPGLGFAVEGFLGERVHEILSGQTAPVVVMVKGPELDVLRRLTAEVTRIMEDTRGLGAVRPEPQIDVPQLSIVPRRAALARFGVTTETLAEAVAQWSQGVSVGQVLGRSGRVMDIVIAGPPEMRTVERLPDIPIDTVGAPVSVGAVADVDVVPAPATVSHEDAVRRITIGADARGGGLSGAVSRLRDRLRALPLPDGYHVEITGEAAARSQAALRLGVIGSVVLVGIFVLLTVAFGSLRDAGIVMVNFPLGLVGGVIVAALNPEGLSVAELVGFVTLFGIIARNGIMLVAHKKYVDVHYADEDPVQRVLRASEERLLPILMTAATAGLGLLPLAVSIFGAGSELESPMAMIVCGGLITSTVLNMLVLPTIYVWLAQREQRRKTA